MRRAEGLQAQGRSPIVELENENGTSYRLLVVTTFTFRRA